MRAKVDSDQPLLEPESNILKLIKCIELRITPTTQTQQEVIDVDQDEVNSTEQLHHLPQRRSERLQHCQQALNRWRTYCWKQQYGDCSWGPKVLLSDTIITKLAT